MLETVRGAVDDCKKARMAPLNANIIIIIIMVTNKGLPSLCLNIYEHTLLLFRPLSKLPLFLLPCLPLNIRAQVDVLPDLWRCEVNARTFWPVVSVLCLGEMVNLVYSFCLSVAARKMSE